MHLAELAEERARRAPTGRCISDDAVTLTNGEFAARIRSVAGLLAQRGVRRGDVVATLLPNRVELVLTLFGAWYLGATANPIDPALTDAEVSHRLEDSATHLVVTDGRRSPTGTADTLDVEALWRAADPGAALEFVADRDGLALLIYTGGDTGRPKGVMLDHTNLESTCAMVVAALGLTGTDHCLLVLPLFHLDSIVVSVLSPLFAGASTTIAGAFGAGRFFGTVSATRPTYFSALPALYEMLCDLPGSVRPDTSSVRLALCVSAPLPAELVEEFEKRFGLALIAGYGLTEGTCASTLNPPGGTSKPGTVGLPLPGQKVAVVGADGSPVPAGELGEVVISGPNVMRGYLNRPGETAKTVVGGWLRTGDVGRFDEDGYLVLGDRVEDMIIRSEQIDKPTLRSTDAA
ncbi:MAG TPA: AMP-binding protein [Pseudonocardia sp.]|jgi:acyl-CoA synthetase (AMP-forming)/AMP-acid ligase II|nr:AMP-binding protein [Pseudonocardia sp.]